MENGPRVTSLLKNWRDGDSEAFEQVAALLGSELRRLAASYLRRERSGHTLQPTALVNEAYIRLIHNEPIDWQSRSHFVAIAARSMRQILVEHARRRLSAKRGSGVEYVSIEDAVPSEDARSIDLLALDEALVALAAVDPRKAQTLEMKYFGGLSSEEIAAVLKVSVKTVERDARIATAWLRATLTRK